MEPIKLSFKEDEQIALGFTESGAIFLNVGEQAQATNYNELYNKPSIESVVLQGNRTFAQLGLEEMTPQDIDNMLYGQGV